MNCSNCNHSAIVEQGGKNSLTCHRNPPHPIPLMGRDFAGQPTMQIIAVWPPVPDIEFCGEWEERAEAGGDSGIVV